MQPSALQRTRRNHAIEHAAMHMLATTGLATRLAARSDWRGLTFYGEVDPATLKRSIDAGLLALETGNSGLAVHPRCGSMVSVSFLLGLLTVWLAESGLRRGATPARGALTLAGIASASLIARPLGERVQAHLLTNSEMGNARLVSIRPSRCGPLTVHRATIAHD